MFGTLRIAREALDADERELYRAAFSAGCHALHDLCGRPSSLLTNDDQTVLALVLAGIGRAAPVEGRACTALPFRTVAVQPLGDAAATLLAALNVAAVRAKLGDDVEDGERLLVKRTALRVVRGPGASPRPPRAASYRFARRGPQSMRSSRPCGSARVRCARHPHHTSPPIAGRPATAIVRARSAAAGRSSVALLPRRPLELRTRCSARAARPRAAGAIRATLVARFVARSAPGGGRNLAEIDLRPLVGANGEAETDLLPRGRVNVRGLTVDAQAASGMIDRGAAFLVTDIDDGRLTVERARR